MRKTAKRVIQLYASRRMPGAKSINKICWKFVRDYRNSGNFEMSENGEKWILAKLRSLEFQLCVDVGAHKGEWVAAALDFWKHARFLCFEPVHEFAEELKRNVQDRERVTIFTTALGSKLQDDAPFFMDTVNPSMSSLIAKPQESAGSRVEISAQISTGDHICDESGITQIDYLKVDCEGHDLEVLKGFKKLIGTHSIRAIQFENLSICNDLNLKLRAKPYLVEIIDFLGPSYQIGRILPKSVDFFEYTNEEEIFGCNFIAIQKNDKQLLVALQ